MKTLKLLFLSLLISLATFTSCTNNEGDNLPDPQESAALQTSLENLRSLFNDNGIPIDGLNPTNNLLFDFCFEFVYPIELIYNNGSLVTVNSFEELIQVLINSTGDLYVVGIEFPFNVEIYNPATNEVEIITITNESEFAALLADCLFGDPCGCDDGFDPVCVEIEDNGVIVVIMFPNECYALCEGFTPNDFIDCEITDPCDCDDTYDPVCVQAGDGIIEFINACHAECEGFTPNDFVDCETTSDCSISELEVEAGECNADGTYPLTINFEYENVDGQEFFDLYVRDNELIGYFALADLPLTIENFELSGFDYDYIKVCINDNIGCCEEEEWSAPDCNNSGGDCDISELEVEVGECNPAGTYSLTINFEYENVDGQEFFDLYVRNDEFIGYFALADLPLTIENFDLSGYDDDYIKVCINDNLNCCEDIEWEAPNCDGGGDDCYEFEFPITMYLASENVEVNSNEDVDYYLELGYDLQYPITISVNNEIITVMQGILEGAYGERCD